MRYVIAIAVSLAAILNGLAVAGAEENPSPYAEVKSNPALSRFGKAIIFYAGFNGSEKAEISPGNPVPQGDAKWKEASKNPSSVYVPGFYGMGLKTADYALVYAYTNPVLGSSGAIALWLKPEVLKHAGTYYWPVNLQVPKGDYGVMFGRMGDIRNKEALYAYMAGTSAICGGMSTWKPGEWHLVVVNWDSGGVEISLDGGFPVRASLKKTLQSNVIGGLTVRLSGASDDTFVMDELLVLDMPMKAEEIRQLYDDGKKASGASVK